MVRDAFVVAKTNELPDGTRITRDRGVSPTVLDSASNVSPSLWRKKERIILDVEERMTGVQRTRRMRMG
jgi:hypothetical protein